MRNNNCFYCLNAGEGVMAENTGWHHPCKLGIPNEDLQDLSKCDKHSTRQGFQIGGYYTHMHFEQSGECLEWFIHSDGQFPKRDEQEFINFHLCDFRQIEEWVKVWGAELRKRGWIREDEVEQ